MQYLRPWMDRVWATLRRLGRKNPKLRVTTRYIANTIRSEIKFCKHRMGTVLVKVRIKVTAL